MVDMVLSVHGMMYDEFRWTVLPTLVMFFHRDHPSMIPIVAVRNKSNGGMYSWSWWKHVHLLSSQHPYCAVGFGTNPNRW
jgi:hypothetical protein